MVSSRRPSVAGTSGFGNREAVSLDFLSDAMLGDVQQAAGEVYQEYKQIDESLDENALAVSSDADGNILIGNFTLTPVGLSIPEGTDQPTWEAIGAVIQRFGKALAWFWGDWLVYGDAHFEWDDDRYKTALEQSNFEYATLRDYAYVARNVPLSIRIDNLSFAHHRAVAPDDVKDKRKWLDRAVERKWSAATLTRQIERAKQPPVIQASNKPVKNPLLKADNKKAFTNIWRSLRDGETVSLAEVKALKKWIAEVERVARGDD